jgi:hypothetical protein
MNRSRRIIASKPAEYSRRILIPVASIRGNGGVHLTTEAEVVTIIQLIVLLAQELARLKKLLTRETGAAASVIDHALELLRQVERPNQEETL